MANSYMSRLCSGHMIAYILVLIGAINWGLIGIGWFLNVNLNIVELLFGSWPILEYLVYTIVGFAAVFMLFQNSCTFCIEKNR